MSDSFSNVPTTTQIYTLSLHDALPISRRLHAAAGVPTWVAVARGEEDLAAGVQAAGGEAVRLRSEEHTSELQSHVTLVCRLLLEKKKQPRSLRQSPVAGSTYLSSAVLH